MINRLTRLAGRLPSGVRQTATYALTPVIAKAISFAMVPVFTHFLTPDDYGRLDVLQTLADLLSIVIGLGLADTLFRFAGSATEATTQRRAAANLFGLSLVTGAVFLVLGQLAAPAIARLLPGDAAVTEVRIILASLAFSAVILVPLSWLRLEGRAGLYVLGTAGRAVGQAALVVVMLLAGFGVTGVLAAGLIACLSLAAWVGLGQLRSTGLRFDRDAWREQLRFGGPLVAAGMAAFVMSSADRWFIAAFDGTAALAPYAVAAKFGLMVAMFFQPFEMWWVARRFPMLHGPDGPARLARSAEIGSLMLAASTVAVATAGPLLVFAMTPADYHGAAAYLPWLALVAAIRAAAPLVNIGLLSGRSTMVAFLIEAASAALALGLFAVMIPVWSAWGAVAATGLALFARLAVTTWMAQRRQKVPHRARVHILALTISVAAAAATTLSDSPWQGLGSGGLLLLVLAGGAIGFGAVRLPAAIARAGLQPR